MKKTVFYLALMTGVMAFLSSCLTTHTMVVDKDVPADQTATITFVNDSRNGSFIVRRWNNNSIVDELYGDKWISDNDKTKLTVPAGNTSFTFDASFSISFMNKTTTYSLKGIELRYNLEQGKGYYIKGLTKSLGLFKGYEMFVSIYNAADNTLLKEWKLGETE